MVTWVLIVLLLGGAAYCHVQGARKNQAWGKTGTQACVAAALVVFARVAFVPPVIALFGWALWAYVRGARKQQEWGKPIVAICTAGLVVAFMGRTFGCYSATSAGSATQKAYFYDVQDKKLFADRITRQPPFKVHGDHEAVRAHVFSCSDCKDESKRIIWYEKWSEKSLAFMAQHPEGPPAGDPAALQQWQALEQEKLVSRDGANWFRIDSEEGAKTAQFACPDGTYPAECTP